MDWEFHIAILIGIVILIGVIFIGLAILSPLYAGPIENKITVNRISNNLVFVVLQSPEEIDSVTICADNNCKLKECGLSLRCGGSVFTKTNQTYLNFTSNTKNTTKLLFSGVV